MGPRSQVLQDTPEAVSRPVTGDRGPASRPAGLGHLHNACRQDAG